MVLTLRKVRGRLSQTARTEGANGFTGLQAHLGTRMPRFNGTGKIALDRKVENEEISRAF